VKQYQNAKLAGISDIALLGGNTIVLITETSPEEFGKNTNNSLRLH